MSVGILSATTKLYKLECGPLPNVMAAQAPSVQRRKVSLTAITRMWANAQPDGRPTKHRWRPLFNAAMFGWRPLLECRAVTLPRRESRWNLQGCLELANRSQPLVGRSSPDYEDMWRRYRCLTNFFRLSIHASAAKIQPDKVVRWCQNGDFCILYFERAACSTFQTCILNSH